MSAVMGSLLLCSRRTLEDLHRAGSGTGGRVWTGVPRTVLPPEPSASVNSQHIWGQRVSLISELQGQSFD